MSPPPTLRVLVVDDEAPARRRLIRMLERLDAIELVGEAEDGEAALAAIRAHAPTLVFLDIHMPGLDGLALARDADLPPFVFVTAHDQHALAAFEVGAADYLLKPVARERLAEAVERVRARLTAPVDAGELAELRATLARLVDRRPAPGPTRITTRVGGTTRLFDVDEIGRFHASDKYTLFRHDSDEHVLDESLSELELRLGERGFVRVHRSELVNLAWVVAVHVEGGGASVELRDGQRAAVSRRMLAEVKRRLER